ncbi:MAG: hypothetical protein J7647_23125 [Cyanobacteria bacterium SBLK]|nr:hypothetical protein [Cyanobacteria bacterium SBLK]
MIKHLFLGLLTSLLIPSASSAAVITWNTQGISTDVPNGILSLDELQTSNSHTYIDVAELGIDIKVSGTQTMVLSTGDLNYTRPGSSIKFEFFETGTINPVALNGFKIDWLDLDSSETMGTFTVVDSAGITTVLDTSSSIFQLGSSLSTTDFNGSNGVNPDSIQSSFNGNWNNSNISFVTDLSNLSIRSFSIDATNGFIAPTSLTIGDIDISVANPVPEPSISYIWLMGACFGLYLHRQRHKRPTSN